MAKLGLKAIGILLKKIVYLANHKYATKADLAVYQNPHFEGDTLVFPSQNAAHFDGDTLVLTE
jgi:hypothetical protein